MQSPFALFRKHARVLTVVLTGLAMFAFIILPQLQQMENQTEMFGVMMAGLLLGTAFWILGRPSGHATEYGVGGLLLGVIIMGFVVPRFAQQNPAVQLSIGSLSNDDVREQMRRMQTANSFVGRVRAKTGDDQQQRGQRFGFGNSAEENSAMVSILNHEADEMGIRLSDEAITEFIKRETSGKLTPKQFKEVRMNLRLSETELYDLLREFLRAELAYTMLMPRVPATPAEFWEYYRRLNVKQEIEVAAVPVIDFESDKAPGDAEIAAFFEKYKDRASTGFVTPEPAFLQPRKIQIAYLEVDYNEVRAQLEQSAGFTISDEDITEYYDENKDLLYVKRPEPEEKPPFEEGKSPDVDKPLDPIIVPDPKSKSDAENPDKQPQPKPDEPKPDDTKPPAPEKSPETKKPANGGQFSVEDPVEKKSDAPSDGDADKTPADSPATVNDDDPVEAPVPGEKVEEEPPPVEYQPLDEDLKAEIREALLTDRLDAATGEKVAEIRRRAASYINDLRNEVIDDFNRRDEPTEEEQAERARTIADKARDYAAKQGLEYVELGLYGAEELAKRGDKAAELWNTLQGSEEKPSTAESKELDYLIAQATEARMKNDNRRSEPRSVLQVLFGTDADRLFTRKEGQDPISNNQYVYWKVADKAAEVPELTDPGIKEQVIAALKTANARKPAEARAQALAKKVREAVKDDESMETVLEGEKVNPQNPESKELLIGDTQESFSWLTTSTARSPSAFAPARPMLSEPTSVEKAGNDFMRVIFDELDEGDVGVAPNADKSIYYVVRVKNRVESPPTGESDFREAYLKQEFFPQKFELGGREFGPFPTTYTFLTSADAGAAVRNWRQQLLEKYEYRRAVQSVQ